MRKMMNTILIVLLALTAWPVMAQTSASFKVEESVFNAGSQPAGSTSFSITLDAIGESAGGPDLSSASFRVDGGFVAAYPPPGEVLGLGFADHETLTWNPEKSAGVYNLYRDLVSNLSGLGYGSCQQQDLTGATATDPTSPPLHDGYFYLVTAENRIAEEGTKGKDSEDVARPNPAPCP
jgi:hypothetical protein